MEEVDSVLPGTEIMNTYFMHFDTSALAFKNAKFTY